MKAQAQNPLAVLRGHTHAVLLVPPDGVLSPSLMQDLRESHAEVELIGHPLSAMAALVWREFNGRKPRSAESTAFIAAEIEIDDLDPLFQAIRNRLPHVSIWLFQPGVAVQITPAQPRSEPLSEPTATSAASATRALSELEAKHLRPSTQSSRETPTLKLSEGKAASFSAREDASTDQELDDIERRFAGSLPADEAVDEDEPAPSAVRISSAEIAMLMDELRDDGDAARGDRR